MRKNRKLFMLFSLVMMLLIGCGGTQEMNSDIEFNKVENKTGDFNKEIIAGINQTGYDVLDLLYSNDASGNLLFSPISMTSALSMLENGASGITKDEILDVLNIESDLNLNETYNALINRFYTISDNDDVEDRPVITINLANSFWFRNNNLDIKQSYIDIVRSFYDGDIYSVDFGKSETKDSMNTWIEDRTNGLLKNTIGKTSSLDIAYLINTLYFKGQWMDEFPKHNTKKEDFTLDNQQKVTVDMMHSLAGRSYFESEDVQVVALNYSNASMYVVLPKENIGMFIEKHDYEDIHDMISDAEYKEVDLYFPKFKFSSNNDLIKILKSLGMPSAFDYSTAEFDDMIESSGDFAVSKAFQNTIIEVDEEGTEAAAVTVIAVTESAMVEPEEPVLMNCNRPFMIIIKERSSDCDLFIGIVQDPSKN
ncbi:MAG: serpin family protein [Clostridiales bacterium]|nr:serpin family protein [Clostridiales bacterium]